MLCVRDICVMLLHWIKLKDLKMGLIWELLNVCQLPIKNAALKRSAGGGDDVLECLAQTDTTPERFPATANCVCAVPS